MDWRRSLIAFWLVAGCGGDDSSDPGSPCDGVTCSGHGSCVVEGSTATCECEEGYEPLWLECIDPDNPETSTVQQAGVTWVFETPVPFGQYANGDYWVLGPVTVTEITPTFTADRHGFEINPSEVIDQGFDGRIPDYDASKVPSLPATVGAGSSIVKGISAEPLDDGDCRPCLKAAAVLTVVGEIPADRGEASFRPPYFGPDKAEYSTEDLHPDLLPSLESAGPPESLEDMAASFSPLQLDHKYEWTSDYIHPVDSGPYYGAAIATRNAEGALRLMLSDPVESKMDALVRYVQYGIDLYYILSGGGSWPTNGGHGEGRKLPLAFAALMLDDQDMSAAVSGALAGAFGENDGVHYSATAGMVLWGQEEPNEDRYWENVAIGTGGRCYPDPYGYVDGGQRPGDWYQFCCTSLPWKATATALELMPDLIPLWNHDHFLDYVERWVDHGTWSQPDPCAPPTGACAGGDNAGADCTTASELDVCTGDDGYCDSSATFATDYGVLYGPDGAGGCITDSDMSDGTGRFPTRHGMNADDGHYGSEFADAMWAAYIQPD